MRKFKFFALAFAAIAFAGCSDDAIDGQGGNTGTIGDGTPAYLTISFSTNGGSSSRADDTNIGDTDGNQENSGHTSDGVEGESKVGKVLVVVSPVSDAGSGFAKLYNSLDEEPEDNTTEGFYEENPTTKTYKNAQPIEVTTGEYNVLVVINPVATIYEDYLETGNNINDGITTGVESLYNSIVTGQYDYTPATGQETTYPDNYINSANSIGMGLAFGGTSSSTADAAFMMANKEEVPVTLTVDNTPDNPAEAEVDVERVLSKITFREKAADNELAANAYEVPVLISAPAIVVDGAIQDPDSDPATYTVYKLNKAKDALGKDIYVRYTEENGENKFVAAYKDSGTDYTPTGSSSSIDIYTALTAVTVAGYVEADKDNSYAVIDKDLDGVVDDDEKNQVNLQFDTDAAESDTWYVKLEGYALVNLSKKVNYIRHTVTNGVMNPFGTVSNTRFLWTPYWDEKNGVVFVENNGEMKFPNTVDPTEWFFNTLEEVSDESKTLAISEDAINFDDADFYKSLSSLTVDGGDAENTGDQHNPLPNSGDLGKLMAYCFENSTDVAHQTHGLSTGISFVARIYSDKACTEPINDLYLYAGHHYTSLAQMKQILGEAAPNVDDESTKEELEQAGVIQYSSNICYYYSTEIKHYDNDEPTVLGPMEYAIMRNNIYSLSVSNIKTLGDPFVDPTPDTPNESTEAALDVLVNLEPWIVRYNDIEFN
ncbi:fimbria major subunit [Bacteroides sp. An51A]|uniref:fimbria major subunit n=1 Tax=Bacteroides sp. An51A TaxID=1965640 RepID=UPI000B378AD4|nr:fimbria major subunit [Bacteroides sp. An51A]OUN80414.1 hypothetical protein B5G04_08445 [Bacteroides sp. An51A]